MYDVGETRQCPRQGCEIDQECRGPMDQLVNEEELNELTFAESNALKNLCDSNTPCGTWKKQMWHDTTISE